MDCAINFPAHLLFFEWQLFVWQANPYLARKEAFHATVCSLC